MPFAPIDRSPLTGPPTDDLVYFTGRADEQAAFDRVFYLTKVPLPLLHFYGVGGIGKTMLLKKLHATATAATLPSAFVDLENLPAGLEASVHALAKLRGQLSAFEMPRFDLALGWYCHKAGYWKDHPARALGSPAGAVADFIEKKAEVSVVGKVLKTAVNFAEDLVPYKWLAELTGGQDYERLKGLTADQIYPQLTTRFIADLTDAPTPSSINNKRRHFCHKAVLFLDTYETLRRQGDATAPGVHPRERWIQELHRSDSPVLIVTAGKERIRWGENDSDYEQSFALEQHAVGGLSRTDAITLLEKRVITDPPLQRAILNTSIEIERLNAPEPGYHPLWLSVCADTVDNIKRASQSIDPATFEIEPNNMLLLADRFLRSLPDDVYKNWVRKLAVPPRFDETAARRTHSEAWSVHQDTEWDTLRGYSFINPMAGRPDWYAFHNLMRDAIVGTTPAVDLTKKHSEWKAYWWKRKKSETDEFAGLNWFHWYQTDPKAASEVWKKLCLEKRAKLDTVGHYALLKWWDPIGLRSTESPSIEEAGFLHELGVELVCATLGSRAGNFRDAIECYEATLQVYTETGHSEDWAAIQNNLGTAYLYLPDGDRAANLRQAIGYYQAALRVYSQKVHRKLWAMTQNNLGVAHGDLPDGDQTANLRRAIEYYEAALQVCTKSAAPEQWGMIQNNRGVAYATLLDGDRGVNLRRAIECHEAALEVYTETNLPEHWAATQNNLGIACVTLPDGDRPTNLRRAIGYFQAALRIHTETSFPMPHAQVQHNLAEAYVSLAEFDDRATNLKLAAECFTTSERCYASVGMTKQAEKAKAALAKLPADPSA